MNKKSVLNAMYGRKMLIKYGENNDDRLETIEFLGSQIKIAYEVWVKEAKKAIAFQDDEHFNQARSAYDTLIFLINSMLTTTHGLKEDIEYD